MGFGTVTFATFPKTVMPPLLVEAEEAPHLHELWHRYMTM